MTASSEDEAQLLEPLDAAFYTAEGRQSQHRARLLDWLLRYRRRLAAGGLDEAARRQRMDTHNPKYVPRNYLAQLATIRRSYLNADNTTTEVLATSSGSTSSASSAGQ